MADKTKRQCKRSSDYTWVEGHERDGEKVSGYCRRKGK